MACNVIHRIKVGDTRQPVGATLKEYGSAVDLSGVTGVDFRMTTLDGTDVVAWASATVVGDGTAGQVTYDFQSGDVDTAGTYKAWFRINSSGEYTTFPVNGDFTIIIESFP